ncbi:hypothetical protein Tco_0943152 [Tanacetum coccineum]
MQAKLIYLEAVVGSKCDGFVGSVAPSLARILPIDLAKFGGQILCHVYFPFLCSISYEKISNTFYPSARDVVPDVEREESKKRKKKIFGVLITQNPAAVFRRSPEFATSDHHDFWTEASLHIKEAFDRWDLDFEAWKFCFLPGQIASCLVIFFLSCSLFVAIYLDIDSKIMMIVVCL